MDNTKEDRDRFSKVMQTLAAAFNKEATMDLIEAYWIGLKDLPIEDVEHGAHAALRELEIMPRPAHLRKMSGDVEPGHRAAIAWQTVRNTLSQHGTYSSVSFDDPVVNATIRNMGGWIALGEKDAADFDVWTRKDFERIYQAIYQAGVTEEAGAYLIGVHEGNNTGFYEVKPPTQITMSLPPPNVRRIESKKVPKKIAAEVVAKAFALAEGT